jgi:hypothetical protein
MGGSGVFARSALRFVMPLLLLAACSAESRSDGGADDGADGGGDSGSSGAAGNKGGNSGVAGTGGSAGLSGSGGSGDSGSGNDGAGGSTSGDAGVGGGDSGDSGAGGSGALGGAGDGGSSMGGAAATSGGGTGGVGGTIGGTGSSCIPSPAPANDPACPSPGLVTTGVLESACTPELSCEFLVPTGDPCFQPPRLQRFECCEWGFALLSCPSLPEGQDPRCVLPITQGGACDDEGLACQVVVYEGGQSTGFICCDGYFRIASSCP